MKIVHVIIDTLKKNMNFEHDNNVYNNTNRKNLYFSHRLWSFIKQVILDFRDLLHIFITLTHHFKYQIMPNVLNQILFQKYLISTKTNCFLENKEFHKIKTVFEINRFYRNILYIQKQQISISYLIFFFWTKIKK